MASRRRGPAADMFGGDQDHDLTSVDNALFGDVQAAERNRVKRRPVDPREIVVDQAIQVRVGGLDAERVETLKQVLLNGGEFKDPVQLVDEDGRLWMADGFHRQEATLQALDDPRVVSGEIEIAALKADIRIGTYKDAINLSEEANLKHGAPLSNADKKNLLWRRLIRGHEWSTGQVSKREMARQLGVQHPTITAWIDEYIQGTGKNLPVRETQGKEIVTKTGQTMDVTKIQKANKKRAKQPPTSTQIKRSIVRNLKAAAAGLEQIGLADHADSLHDYIRERSEEWNL